jgi:hypothetical protein
MSRKLMSYDEEIGEYLDNVINSIKSTGIKRVSRNDALRFIIKQNLEANLNFRRKPKAQKDFEFYRNDQQTQ